MSAEDKKKATPEQRKKQMAAIAEFMISAMGINMSIADLRREMHAGDDQFTHRHQCDKCGTVWEHTEGCGGNDEAHHCPKQGCPGVQYYRYDGSDTPLFAGNCIDGKHLIVPYVKAYDLFGTNRNPDEVVIGKTYNYRHKVEVTVLRKGPCSSYYPEGLGEPYVCVDSKGEEGIAFQKELFELPVKQVVKDIDEAP